MTSPTLRGDSCITTCGSYVVSSSQQHGNHQCHLHLNLTYGEARKEAHTIQLKLNPSLVHIVIFIIPVPITLGRILTDSKTWVWGVALMLLMLQTFCKELLSPVFNGVCQTPTMCCAWFLVLGKMENRRGTCPPENNISRYVSGVGGPSALT